MKMETKKVKKVFVVILAWKKSKAQSRVWFVQNDVRVAETLTKGTRG